MSLDQSIPGALANAAARIPSQEAVVDGMTRLTFADLHHLAEEYARAFIGSGLEPGDRIALWAPNSAAWIAMSFGVYAAGGVLVPFNTRYRGEEAGHILRTSGARVLVTVTDFLNTDYASMLAPVRGLDALEEVVILSGEVPDGSTSIDDFRRRGHGPEIDVARRVGGIQASDASDIIFTSGTTGAPKGAVLSHGASVRTYREWSRLVDLRDGDRYLVVYPFFHTAGLKSGILACVLQGATIYPLPVFDVPAMLKLVTEERITMLPGPPTVFQTILDHPDRGTYDLSSIRSSVTGAAVVPVEVIRRMREDLGIRTVVTGYGMTETTGTISMCRFDDPPDVIAETVGRPLPGVEVRVLDEQGEDVAAGGLGEFAVRGFNVMEGYFRDEEGTKAAFRNGWLLTGDVGFIDAEGNLRITDRKKDMFIVGGFNVYPAEIEAVLLRHPAISQVAVVGVPDVRLGEVGVAFIALRPGLDADADADAILRWAHERMAKYKLDRVILLNQLPTNPSGKVMKFKLREHIANG